MAGPADKVVAFKRKATHSSGAPRPDGPDPEEERRRVRTNVLALIFAAILVCVGWLLVDRLGAQSRMEDCLMSGRTNCAPIAARPAGG